MIIVVKLDNYARIWISLFNHFLGHISVHVFKKKKKLNTVEINLKWLDKFDKFKDNLENKKKNSLTQKNFKMTSFFKKKYWDDNILDRLGST